MNLMSTNFAKFASKSTENTNSMNHMFTSFLGGVSVQNGQLNNVVGQTGALGNGNGFLWFNNTAC